MATTAIATQQEPRQVTVALLPKMIQDSKDARAFIAPFLPPGVDLDRVAASLKVALSKARADHKGSGEPALFKCDPMSVFMAVAKISQWGLEVGETAHLVPFGSSCVPVADYKGLAELVIASGVARHVEAHCVYANEPFRLRRGSHGTDLEHDPLTDGKARGAMIGAYAMYFLRGGVTMVEYMTVEDIDAVRQKYSKQWTSGPLPEWYARKSVVRRGIKLLPKNPRLAERLASMDLEVADVPAELAALTAPRDIVDPETGEVLESAPVQRGPKPLVEGGYEPAPSRVPVAPDSVDDGPDVDRGELDLGETRSTPTRRSNAQID
jgi:phage RecT family recombinase